MIILDTNVLSEILRSRPHRRVADWLNGQRRGDLFTTAVTLGEMLFGVALLPTGRRKTGLLAEVERLLDRGFRGRVLNYGDTAARAYADLAAHRQQAGRRMPTADAQIAGICLARGATLATRNTTDFEGTGVDLVNPWEQT